MRTAHSALQSPGARAPAGDPPSDGESAHRRLSGAVETARTSAATLVERAPGTVRAARAGAREATSALQALPDSTLRWLSGASVGLAAGLTIARAPRLVRAAAAVPALIMGAVIALRPTEHGVPALENNQEQPGGTTAMTDEQTKGTINKAKGTVEEEIGKLTGDKEQQVHGKAKRVQGDAQKVLGDVQDAVRKPRDDDKA
jgi:uncharacterized protein YjbJ (UPF0337 family)